MKTVNELRSKTNQIEFRMDEYADALKKSMYDEEWINNLYTDKENLFRLFERLGRNSPIKNAVRFSETRDIRYLLETKNNLVLPDSISSLYFDAGKPEQTMALINEIYSNTYYYAERIQDLLNEAEGACMAHHALRNPIPWSTRLVHNGEQTVSRQG